MARVLREIAGKTLDFLRRRKKAYQLTFSSPSGQEVMMDLMRFCRGRQTCFDPDPRIHAVLEGRREVWLRIEQHMNLSSQELYELYGGRNVVIDTGEENNE